jgi:anti-sigma-K factor RskA
VNIQEYILSGIVESYVLGLADKQERAEFENMCAAHPEVRNARIAFEMMLEEQSMQSELQPSKSLRSKIFSEIQIEADKSLYSQEDISDKTDIREGKTISISPWLRYVAAASVILLIGSIALNIYYYNQYRNYNSRYNALVTQQSEIAQNNNALQSRINQYEDILSIIRNPDMAAVRMPGTEAPGSPDTSSLATVFWDTKSKDVYLMVNNLPQPAADKQYQLWAIVDGVPVDAGVFDVKEDTLMFRMKNIPRAEMFAVTLEKRGGNPTPQGQMYVLGKT